MSSPKGPRGKFIVRVDDGSGIQPFKGDNLRQILNNIDDKYNTPKKKRR